MIVEVEALVTYSCYLSDEDEQKVTKLAEQNDISLKEAAEILYNNAEIDLYQDSRESDFSTQDFIRVEEE